MREIISMGWKLNIFYIHIYISKKSIWKQFIFKTGTWAELREAPIGSRKKYEKKTYTYQQWQLLKETSHPLASGQKRSCELGGIINEYRLIGIDNLA